MLKGIPKILSPELLKVLCEMGHSDRLVISDGNFPAETMGKNAIVIRCDGHGVPELLDGCQDWLRSGRGRLILMSAYERGPVNFDFRKAIAKSIDFHVPHPGHSLNQMDDMRRAIALINNGTFRVKELISHEYKLSEITKAFEDLEHKPAGFLKGIVVPD
jgi:threonine dehydrogenase-like Zn-dependent dehydrogenase